MGGRRGPCAVSFFVILVGDQTSGAARKAGYFEISQDTGSPTPAVTPKSDPVEKRESSGDERKKSKAGDDREVRVKLQSPP